MSTNFRVTIAVVIGIIVFCVVVMFLSSGRPVVPATVGGGVDKYGCLNTAGYTWNEYVGACIRGFELNETQRAVAKIAVENIGQAKGLSVTAVEEEEECVGCFIINTVVAGTDKIKTINIENWAVVDLDKKPAITIDEAIIIAEGSECMNDGEVLTDEYMYNENSKTWWIDMENGKENCYPACVVNEESKTAEINWRCTGLLEEEIPDAVY